MSDNVSNPQGTGETLSDAAAAFASYLSVAEPDGDTKQSEAPPGPEAVGDDPEAEEAQLASDEAEEAEEEEQSEEGESEEEAAPQPTTFKVKVDGEEVEVTLEELQKGYSRTQDYTRKTQALAEQRKAAEAELETVRQERAYYAQMVQALEKQLSQAEPEPDWDRLYQENPTEWVRQRELWRDKQDKLRAVQAENQRLSAMQQQEQAKAMQARLKEEAQKLVDAVPEWKDSKKAAEERGKLLEAAKRVGFSEDDLAGISDHRAIIVLRKAALYDELMSKKSSIKPTPTSGPRPAKPGSASTVPSKKSESVRAQERLARSGSMKDAVAAFDSFI